jgi:hypothetical protein
MLTTLQGRSACVRCTGVLPLAAMLTTQFVCRLGALLALVATTAVAQKSASDWNTVKALTTGTDVRITTGSRTVSGKVDRITDETLTMTSGKGSEMFSQQDVTRVSVGKNGHRVRNALIGLGIGTGAGTGIGLGVGHANDCSKGWFCGLGTGIGGALGGAIGLVGGTAVGALIPSGGWREVYEK